MNGFIKITVCMVGLLSLIACSSRFDNSGEQRYLSSRNGQQLVVPPPLTTANIGYFYNLPAQTQDARVTIQPPTV